MTRVLVIDDEADILAIVEGVLLANGHHAVISTEPREAVPLAMEHRAEVIVLDVNMPELSGLETLAALRANPKTAAVPVLFLSALGDTEHKIRGLRRGADDYLAKPFAGDELVLRIERLAAPAGHSRMPASSQPEVIEEALRTGDFGSEPVCFGRYQAREILGRGGMGLVLRAFDPILKRPVAVKTLRLERLSLELESAEGFVDHLLREAAALARFNHPNVVGVYDAGAGAGSAFIVMELVEGVNLMDLVVDDDCLQIEHAIYVGREIARALATTHRHEILHRDVKPGNVLVSYEGAVKVTDFGLADTVSFLAGENGIFGTPGYVPPETLLGHSYRRAGDVFGLGATLYLCLTGVPAFSGQTLAKLLARTLAGPPTPPHEIRSEIPPALSALVLRLLDGDPKVRPAPADLEQQLADMLPCEPYWDPAALRRSASKKRSQPLTFPATLIDSRHLAAECNGETPRSSDSGRCLGRSPAGSRT